MVFSLNYMEKQESLFRGPDLEVKVLSGLVSFFWTSVASEILNGCKTAWRNMIL